VVESERLSFRIGGTGSGTVNGSGSGTALRSTAPALSSVLTFPSPWGMAPQPETPSGIDSPAPPKRPSLKN
jgi:hypothetical protein